MIKKKQHSIEPWYRVLEELFFELPDMSMSATKIPAWTPEKREKWINAFIATLDIYIDIHETEPS